MADALEWRTRSYYSTTELVLFILTSLVLFVTLAFSFVYSYLHIRRNVSFFSILRPLFENVLPTAVAFTPAAKDKQKHGGGTGSHQATDGEATDSATQRQADRDGSVETTDSEGTDGRSDEEETINIVVLGHEEKSPDHKSHKMKLVRIWVHVYFIMLCGLIIIWTISVFTDSVLYRKSSSCNDISLEDKDLSCFLLSNRDIPDGVQEIIDEEPGELVPCPKVHSYIQANNLTYDLEVICYQYQLNPLAAVGISYGTMKSISFVIIAVMSVLFAFVDKLFQRQPLLSNKSKSSVARQRPRRKITVSAIIMSHVCFVVLSLAIIAILAIVSAIVHEVAGLRNSGYDYLRGDKFYSYSVIVLAPITILYLSFVPWWALEPLKKPPGWNVNNSDSPEVATKKLFNIVHRILLHQKFSTPFALFLDFINSDLGKLSYKTLEGVEEGKVEVKVPLQDEGFTSVTAEDVV